MRAFFYLIFNDGIFNYIMQSHDKSAIKASFIKIFCSNAFSKLDFSCNFPIFYH